MKPGQVLIENLFMSVDPYMRRSMDEAAHDLAPWPIGGALNGPSAGRIIESRNADFEPGDIVESMSGWQEHFISDGDPFVHYISADTAIAQRAANHDPKDYLGLFGVAALALTLVSAPPAHAAGDPGAISLLLDAATILQPAGEPDAALPAPALRFAEAGFWSWELSAGVALASQSTSPNLAWDAGVFLADRFELTFGVAGWAFLQDGTDAAGANPRFAFRLHFLERERYTIYAEVGIGLLFSTDDVPDDGQSFNFTPRAGVGSTIAIGDEGHRLDVGLRWHHVSTASTTGSDDNPSRDGIEIYLGIIVPF